MVLGFVSLGKFLEDRTKKHSLNSLGLLLQLTPKQVRVQRNGEWQTVPLNQIQVGELLRANQGERIAADGVVEEGTGWCDESHLTGESLPEMKKSGSPVLAGAMVTDTPLQGGDDGPQRVVQAVGWLTVLSRYRAVVRPHGCRQIVPGSHRRPSAQRVHAGLQDA